MENASIKTVKTVFDTICKMLDDKGFVYEKKEDDNVIKCTLHGEDLPMDILIIVLGDKQIVQLLSPMPFTVPEDKRVDIALATTLINYKIADGSFDFDMDKGRVLFRLTSSFRESLLGKDLFEYMLLVSAATIDEYNDKLFMMAKGMMSLEQFKESEE